MKKNIICKILGHKWGYNFVWMPNKRKCKICGRFEKMRFDESECPLTGNYQIWEEAEYDKTKTKL